MKQLKRITSVAIQHWQDMANLLQPRNRIAASSSAGCGNRKSSNCENFACKFTHKDRIPWAILTKFTAYVRLYGSVICVTKYSSKTPHLSAAFTVKQDITSVALVVCYCRQTIQTPCTVPGGSGRNVIRSPVNWCIATRTNTGSISATRTGRAVLTFSSDRMT